MNQIEQELASKFNKAYCCLTGSGTTAIYLILKSLNLQNKKILYPAITCMAPVNAALYAGYEPVFCDVNLQNYTMDINSLEQMIETYDVGIIVPTHIYGHHCDMNSICNIAKKRDIFVLEDAAQTTSLMNADVSIMSFGHTKILECKTGGGALFTDNQLLYEKVLEIKETIPSKPKYLDQMLDEYRAVYYSIMECIKRDKRFWSLMLQLQQLSKDTFIYNEDNNVDLLDSVNNMDVIANKRMERTKLYDKYLNKDLIDLPKIDVNCVRWRYSFLFTGNQKELLHKVREKNVDISNWYPSLHKVYSHQDGKYFKNADYIENHIVNLWINPQYSEDKIGNDIEIINSVIENIGGE
jgi:dTDP-4-amino-4,6-dideoxygalactose transaminase